MSFGILPFRDVPRVVGFRSYHQDTDASDLNGLDPTGTTAEGDGLIAFVFSDSDTDFASAPSGWTGRVAHRTVSMSESNRRTAMYLTNDENPASNNFGGGSESPNSRIGVTVRVRGVTVKDGVSSAMWNNLNMQSSQSDQTEQEWMANSGTSGVTSYGPPMASLQLMFFAWLDGDGPTSLTPDAGMTLVGEKTRNGMGIQVYAAIHPQGHSSNGQSWTVLGESGDSFDSLCYNQYWQGMSG